MGQDEGGASAVYTDVTRASSVWAAGTDGTGVTVALIDSGVNDTGDLAGTVIHAEDMTGTGSADLLGHGTFIAGLIAGSGASANGGPNPGTISKPADDPYVISVGSSEDHTTVAQSDDTMASFSAVGPTADGVVKPDVVTSGRSVISTRAAGSYADQTFPEAR